MQKGSYIVWVPGRVGRCYLGLHYNVGYEDHQQKQWTDNQPTHLPENVRSPPCHELNVITEPVVQHISIKLKHTHTHFTFHMQLNLIFV